MRKHKGIKGFRFLASSTNQGLWKIARLQLANVAAIASARQPGSRSRKLLAPENSMKSHGPREKHSPAEMNDVLRVCFGVYTRSGV
jgi:hypothetical protein